MAVDFYNHETKSTDMAEGFEPIYNTLFSFKNTSDDFYIKYLEKDHILVDVFYAPKASTGAPAQAKPVKLGSAKLPLNRLLNKDFSFQAQEIWNERINQSIGKLFYRMRPRKDLSDALKWYKEGQAMKLKKGLSNARAEPDAAPDTQIVEIVVEKASGLQIHGNMSTAAKKNMLPFFYYDFYRFSETSGTAQGDSPIWDHSRKYEVEKGHFGLWLCSKC